MIFKTCRWSHFPVSCNRSVCKTSQLSKVSNIPMDIILVIGALLLLFFILLSSEKHKNFPPGYPNFPLLGSLPYMTYDMVKCLLFYQSKLFYHFNQLVPKFGHIFGFYLLNQPVVIISDIDIAKKMFRKDGFIRGFISNVKVNVIGLFSCNDAIGSEFRNHWFC